jgi:CheY-specific phosphatase CheX
MNEQLEPKVVQRLLAVVISHLRHTVGIEAVLAAIDDLHTMPEGIAVTIDFVGDVRGPVTWVFPETIALELVRRLMSDPSPAPELALEGATELANILTGRATGELEKFGFSCHFGVPRPHMGELPAGIKMRITTVDGPIDIVLSMSRTRPLPVVPAPA